MTVPSWIRHPPPVATDVFLTLLVGASIAGLLYSPGAEDPMPEGTVFALAATLPLLARRRWPLGVLVVVTAAGVGSPVDLPYVLPLAVAAYSLGATGDRQRTIGGLAAVLTCLLAYALADGTRLGPVDVVLVGLVAGVTAAVGAWERGKSLRIVRLSREAELLAERAVAEERIRIAQELHDVVAHNVSLIVVQAQALGATQPTAKPDTDAIADLGRRTMAEMHRTLRLLRDREGDGPELTPPPGLADLDELLASSRAAGLPVELAVEGAPRRLAQSVDLSAFRIVQEALTNVLKHAGRPRTAVTVAYGREALELTIVDSGAGAAGARPGAGGHGLIGMRERAALFGGTLSAGPRAGHGFEVRASLPYDDRPA